MTAPIRATFLTQMPSPYMRDLFAAMRADGRIIPRVLYMETALPGTRWKTPQLRDNEQVLPGRGLNILGGRVQWNPTICSALRNSDANIVIVSGYSSLTTQIATRWLRRRNRPWIFFGERPGIKSRRLPGRVMRATAMSAMLRSASAVAAVGISAVEAYQSRCRNSTRVFNIPYYTDTAPFLAAPARPGERDGQLRILYCGQLIERKGVDLLIKAFCRVASQHSFVSLHLVGEGAMHDHLREMVPSPLNNRVAFHGFSTIEELPQHFSRADFMVLPSRHDGWGVVINQALAAGLPIVASDAVGAAQDYVAGRGTGLIVPAGDEMALTEALARFASDTTELRLHARRARMVAPDLSLQCGVDRWVAMLQATLSSFKSTTQD